MNSLLAALIELRIFIFTLCVSGAVHLTLMGGGWFNHQDPVRVGGAPLNIRVTVSRDDGRDAIVDAQRQLSGQTRELQTQPQTEPQTEQSIASQTGERLEKQRPALSGTLKDNAMPVYRSVQADTDVRPSPAPGQPAAPTDDLKPVLTPDDVAENDVIKTDVNTTDVTETDVTETKVLPSDQRPVPSEYETPGPQGTLLFQAHPEFSVAPEPPVYPRLARKRGIEGEVILHVEIARDGGVAGLRLEQSSGSDLLDQAALSAVQRWQFVPATQNGVAVASYVRVPVNFVLENQ